VCVCVCTGKHLSCDGSYAVDSVQQVYSVTVTAGAESNAEVLSAVMAEFRV